MHQFKIEYPIEKVHHLLSEFILERDIQVLEIQETPYEFISPGNELLKNPQTEDLYGDFVPSISKVTYSLKFKSSSEPATFELTGYSPNTQCQLDVFYPFFEIARSYHMAQDAVHRYSIRLLRSGEVPNSAAFRLLDAEGSEIILHVRLDWMQSTLKQIDSFVNEFFEVIGKENVVSEDFERALELVNGKWEKAVKLFFEDRDSEYISTKLAVEKKTVQNAISELRRKFKMAFGYKLHR